MLISVFRKFRFTTKTKMSNDLVALFQRVGLSSEKAAETVENSKLAPLLEQAIQAVSFTVITDHQTGISVLQQQGEPVDKSVGPLLYHLASSVKGAAVDFIPFIAQAIKEKKLLNGDQINAAVKYVNSLKGSQPDSVQFDEACGVGIVVDAQEIQRVVDEIFEKKKNELEAKRYALLGSIFGAVKLELKWADSVLVKEIVDAEALKVLGPKEDLKIKVFTSIFLFNRQKKKEKAETRASRSTSQTDIAGNTQPSGSNPAAANSQKVGIKEAGSIQERAKSTKFVFEGELARLHKPGGNPQINPQLMVDHLKRTGGKVITRFPPEPNGFLHIGHAKAININFGYAAAFNGITNLRYDDTNPEAEEQVYFDSILETVKWLGYEPTQITYSSDHFQRLFDLAVEMIKRDKAYVCHCTAEEMHAQRGGDAKGPRHNSPWRDRPIEESLAEFHKMKQGHYKEGEAVLRMKMDMQHPNPQFWDLVAYRIMYTAHMRTHDEWCIYPTYDYTHCLCDSFEDITHSLCTTEFVLSRESYYWLVDALELYKPVQWEYGRLKLTNTVLSKRKLMKLVDEKIVSGWDDPRLFTLEAVRRRGFTPEAINAFVRELGVTTANTTIPVERLENYVRDHLNEEAGRLMVVLDPLKITIENLDENFEEMVQVPNHPRNPEMGLRLLPFTKTVYIDQSDFKEQADPNFYRLCLGRSVGLLNVPFPITATRVVKDASGKVVEVKAKYENSTEFKKPKTYIQWVAHSSKHSSPVSVQVREYANLFIHSEPENKEMVPGGWLSDINPDSLRVIPNAFADIGVLKAKTEDKFQFLRIGYFCVDRDTLGSTIVFNKTVSLKEDNKKDK